jgi:hypothetical protein
MILSGRSVPLKMRYIRIIMRSYSPLAYLQYSTYACKMNVILRIYYILLQNRFLDLRQQWVGLGHSQIPAQPVLLSSVQPTVLQPRLCAAQFKATVSRESRPIEIIRWVPVIFPHQLYFFNRGIVLHNPLMGLGHEIDVQSL